ncbi:hypothetical protein BHE74_00001806 [Ensete ventricosum]|nr:hypothetical protein BHE74_00001806 [Ensete ventricosum]
MRRIHIVAARRRIILVSLLLGVCFQVLYQDVIVAGDVRNAIVERFPGATFSLAPWQEQRKGGGKEIPPLVPKESPPESWSTGNRVGPRGEGAGSINHEIDRERESDRGSIAGLPFEGCPHPSVSYRFKEVESSTSSKRVGRRRGYVAGFGVAQRADPSTLVAPETGELSHFETAGPATARPIGTRAERLGRRERAHLLLRHRRGPGYTHVTHTCTVASS